MPITNRQGGLRKGVGVSKVLTSAMAKFPSPQRFKDCVSSSSSKRRLVGQVTICIFEWPKAKVILKYLTQCQCQSSHRLVLLVLVILSVRTQRMKELEKMNQGKPRATEHLRGVLHQGKQRISKTSTEGGQPS